MVNDEADRQGPRATYVHMGTDDTQREVLSSRTKTMTNRFMVLNMGVVLNVGDNLSALIKHGQSCNLITLPSLDDKSTSRSLRIESLHLTSVYTQQQRVLLYTGYYYIEISIWQNIIHVTARANTNDVVNQYKHIAGLGFKTSLFFFQNRAQS